MPFTQADHAGVSQVAQLVVPVSNIAMNSIDKSPKEETEVGTVRISWLELRLLQSCFLISLVCFVLGL